MVESIFVTKIDYCESSINKLIKTWVRFAKPKYGELSDISHLNWLLIEARVNFTSMKFVSKALNKKVMLENL